MAKGDGSITQRGKGVWEVAISCGKDPITGKYRRITKTVHGTKRDAAKVRDQIKQELESGISIEARSITLAQFVPMWASAKRTAGRASEDTIVRETKRLEPVLERIGNVRLMDIDARTIEAVYADIMDERCWSGTTLHHLHVTLKNVLKKAVNSDLIVRNPCERVESPQMSDHERKSLSADESASLLARVDEAETRAYAKCAEKEHRQAKRGNTTTRSFAYGIATLSKILAVRIAMATGMRRGEVFGLTWDAVDLNAPSVRVEQSLTRYGTTKKPKTKKGIRTVHLDPKTAAHLSEWKRFQASMLFSFGVKQGASTPVCCSNVGGWIDLSNFEGWWQQFRENAGFPSLKFHELRHTQASQLLANGVDVKTVQERLGHANASITLDWYAHAMPENDAKAALVIGDVLAGKARPKARIINLKTA